jgi:hypothetical protein
VLKETNHYQEKTMKLDLEQTFDVQTVTKVSTKRILDLIVTAFEGGSNYWIEEVLSNPPAGTKYEDYKEGGKHAATEYYPAYQVLPFVGGSLTVIDNEDGTKYCLNSAAIADGLQLMATKYPRHWNDFINENDDASTADVFLQCAILGEIVFG